MSRSDDAASAEASALARLNALPRDRAEEELRAVCGSTAWARAVAERRPFADPSALVDAAEAAWDALAKADWLEAFAAHPRIGESRMAGGSDASTWSREEQARAMGSEAGIRARLAEAQRRYEERFGHVFLICASGKTAEDIITACSARLDSEPAAELDVAAGEERKIGRLRLAKCLAESAPNPTIAGRSS
jgi:OHCU decarboxylase